MKRLNNAFRLSLFCVLLLLILTLTGCGDKTKIENLQTTNDASGWTCSFDSLNGDYTNAFPVNGKSIRITSSVASGKMDVILKADGVAKELDGSDLSQSVPVSEFGDSQYLYITFRGENAGKGNAHIVWEK